MTFEEFLNKANELIYGPKTVANPATPETTNLNAQSGGDKDPQVEHGIDYTKVTF